MKYIIFDIDGTLTDTTRVDDLCYIKAFETLFKTSIRDVKWSELKNVTDWGITEELLATKLNRDLKERELIQLKELFIEYLNEAYASDRSQFDEIRGAKYFFSHLVHHADYRVGIATGGWEESALFKLEAIGLEIEDISFSNSNYFKTRGAIVKDVLDKLKEKSITKADEVIYIGDGQWDYQTCKELGIRFVGIDYHDSGVLEQLCAQEVYRDFHDIVHIMNSIGGGTNA